MYANKRHLVFLVIGFCFFSVPFFVINGNHLFLLSFDKKELHLLFTKFDMQELYLMPFIFISMFLFIFFITTLAGRIWCGWGCPQTIFRSFYRDFLQTFVFKTRKNLSNKQNTSEDNFGKNILPILAFMIFSFVVSANFLWFFVPPEDFFEYIKYPQEHMLLFGIFFCIAMWLVVDIVFLQEKFCVYVCPYARIQSVMFDNDTVQVIYDEGRGGKIYEKGVKLFKKPKGENDECIGCESCVKVCPTHIDIRKGMQLDCINCLECVDACSKVMAKFSKPSLVSWTSENSIKTRSKVRYFRFRTIAYIIMLIAISCILLFVSSQKENMLLNINRTSELYNITAKNKIENYYTFLFQNTDKIDHTYYFDTNSSNLVVTMPSKPFVIKAGKKKRLIVVLESGILNLSSSKDTPVKITVNAYATDDKKRVSVQRETVFVYPKKNVLE